MSFLKKRWWRKFVVSLSFVAALAQASIANADWSKATKFSFQKTTAYFEIVKKKMKKDKRGSWNENEKNKYGNFLVKFCKSLAKDIVRDLRAKKYKEAISEFNQFHGYSKILERIGRFDEVKAEYLEMSAIVKSVLRHLKKKHKSRSVTKQKLPNGTFIFYSQKEGVTFYLKLRIFKSKGQIVFDVYRRGLPLMKGQWKEASAGKPQAIIDFVKKYVLKNKFGKIYISKRTEGNK